MLSQGKFNILFIGLREGLAEEDGALHLPHRIMDFPLAEMAHATGETARRLYRRAIRRKGGAAVALGFAITGFMVGGNALWDQDERHPAPLWGRGEVTAMAAHNGSAQKGAPLDVAAVRDVSAPSSQMVGAVQEALRASGWYDGPADGVLDDVTVEAIEAFEADQGLPVTGEPSVGLMAALSAGDPLPPAAPRTDLSVLEIQRRLNAGGYGPLAEDGRMGPNTQRALDSFAMDLGLAGGPREAIIRALASGGA